MTGNGAAMKKRSFTRLALVVAAIAFVGVAECSADQNFDRITAWRRIDVTVLDTNDKPVSGTLVKVFATDRYLIHSDGWDKEFSADHNGRAVIRLPASIIWAQGRKAQAVSGPYYLIVGPTGSAPAAVSQPLMVDESLGRPGENEWGKATAIGPEGLSIKLKRRKPVRVVGTVTDMGGLPVAGRKIGLYHNLHAQTHTGRGGEIMEQFAETGPDGLFSFRSVYPARFCLTVDGPACWLRTYVEGELVDDCVDEVDPAEGVEETSVGIQLGLEHRFRFYVRVSDKSGNGIPDAEIVFGVSGHKEDRTWADSHRFERAKTGPDGAYELRTGTPWILWHEARKTNYAQINADKIECDGRGWAIPGKVGFVMREGDDNPEETTPANTKTKKD